MELFTRSAEEMHKTAAEFALRLAPKENRATVVTLAGVLGAGKTTFARGVARAYGIEEDVTSPTFVIEKIYPVKERRVASNEAGAFERLIHIDAYRLSGARELEALGWKELAQEPGNLIILEWPEQVLDAIPKDAVRVTIQFTDDDNRIISYE